MTCGHDCDVRTFVGLEDDDVSEFSLSSSKLTALVCYTTPAELEGGGADVVTVAIDDNTVQAFASDVSWYNILTIHQWTIAVYKVHHTRSLKCKHPSF